VNNSFEVTQCYPTFINTRKLAIAYNSFGLLQSNKDFQAPLTWAN